MHFVLPAPEIAWPIFVLLILEWMVWPIVMLFLPDDPKCPICKNSFRWNELDADGIRRRPASFPCPKCKLVIGAPSWRRSFLWVSYLTLIFIFLFVLFDSRGDLFLGYLGAVLAAVGAMRIANWFIWKMLEPGSSPETGSSSMFS
jgi:hypothetical protein